MYENRRRCFRVPLHTEVTCTVGTRTVKGITWNISQGGIQIEVTGLNCGDAVRLAFCFPGSSVMVEAFGKVVWSGPDRQGIQFTKVTLNGQAEISAFISQAESPDWQVN